MRSPCQYTENSATVKADFLQIALKFAAYQKEQSSHQTSSENSETLEEMTSAVKKMAETLGSKPNVRGLEKSSVPAWDGNCRTCNLEKGIQSLDEEIWSG